MNIDIEYIEKGDIVWVDKTLKYCIVVDIWLTMGNKYTICFEQAIFSIPNVFIHRTFTNKKTFKMYE
jgi:hypothetical protein